MQEIARKLTASGKQFSSADVYGHLMHHKTNPIEALNALPQLIGPISKTLMLQGWRARVRSRPMGFGTSLCVPVSAMMRRPSMHQDCSCSLAKGYQESSGWHAMTLHASTVMSLRVGSGNVHVRSLHGRSVAQRPQVQLKELPSDIGSSGGPAAAGRCIRGRRCGRGRSRRRGFDGTIPHKVKEAVRRLWT